MQREITEKSKLLNEDGELIQRGYGKKLLLDYDRNAIKARSYRIKEWDYYLVYNNDIGIALTIDDNSYMGLVSASFLNFNNPSYKTTSIIKPFTFGKMKMPSTSQIGDIKYEDKRVNMQFLNYGVKRVLKCSFKEFDNDKDLACDIVLTDEPKDCMMIATPFKEDSKAFYYNQKINCMRAEGKVTYGKDTYILSRDNTFGTLDWGRGVWTYKNTWYWGSASGLLGDKTFGFNIGYGFGDTSAASENMIFYDGYAHKLDGVKFNIPEKNGVYEYMEPWEFTSTDGRFEMKFMPILDRIDMSSVYIISSRQHQVFGRFTGNVILDNGENIYIKDFLGFAEHVENKW